MTSLTGLRSQFAHLEEREALDQPASSLLGVSADASAALAQVASVETVLDLACSQLFANAADICLLEWWGKGRFAASGHVPRDLLRPSSGANVEDLARAPVQAMNWYGTSADLAGLGAALDVVSVGDLASWPPYLAARRILERVYGKGEGEQGEPPDGAPTDLLPNSGEYPTERVQYEALLFDGFLGGSSSAVGQPIDGPVDLAALIANEGYQRPGIGGILTFTQSWYTKALSLGNLIHSVSLAPGESTKIAMIDWSRRTSTRVGESIDESEALFSDTSRARAISEVTRAVARETQEGRSAASSTAFAEERGEAQGEAHLRDVNLLQLGVTTHPGVVTSGSSFGAALGLTSSTGWSTTAGERDISAVLAQDVIDKTHQASHAVRSRRASIVREASQSEREAISTRTLTNYNHMHALTLEYYEVVQLYRMTVELTKADRCAFVPMRLLDFRDQRIVDRYRQVLARAALSPSVAQVLEYPAGMARLTVPSIRTNVLTDDMYPDAPNDKWPSWCLGYFELASGQSLRVLPDGRLIFPADASITEIMLRNTGSGDTTSISVNLSDGSSITDDLSPANLFTLPQPVRIADLQSIYVTGTGFASDDKAAMFISYRYGRSGADLEFPIIRLDSGVSTLALSCEASSPDTISHLVDNQLYYSQAIWRSLDPATVGIMLSNLTWPVAGVDAPMIEVVDPRPVAVAANYLVLRLSGGSESEHSEWLQQNRIFIGERREEIVPIPSGGVFAEAVLGRSNSAERLELTRFWNWQDSPIPVVAPEIAPVASGTRGQPDETTPSTLGSPVLNIVNPAALPDPQGMGTVLAAIQNASMFRDMSGLAATIGLSQAGLSAVQTAATEAAKQAGHNAEVAAELGAKVAQSVADVAKAYLARSGGGSGSAAGLTGGLSGQGARVAQGQDMDRRGVPLTPGAAETGGRPIGGSEPGPRMTGRIERGLAPSPLGQHESAAFKAALGVDYARADGLSDGNHLSLDSQTIPAAASGEWIYWAQLLVHRPPSSLEADLSQRGIWILRLDDAWGDVNLDYYPVRIRDLPTIAGQPMSPSDLLRYVRINFNSFVDVNNSSFAPLDANVDATTWEAEDPLGAVMNIEINTGDLVGLPPTRPLIDQSLVVCSKTDPERWTFSTVKGASAAGHPVSGNRSFGVDAVGDGWILYTMGADRATSFIDWTANAVDLIWRGTDALWSGFQERVAAFVNENGGAASATPRHSGRYSWLAIGRSINLPYHADA